MIISSRYHPSNRSGHILWLKYKRPTISTVTLKHIYSRDRHRKTNLFISVHTSLTVTRSTPSYLHVSGRRQVGPGRQLRVQQSSQNVIIGLIPNMLLYLSQGAKWVYLTWDAVKGCLVSFCSVTSTYQILTAQPENYVAGKKLYPFSHFSLLLILSTFSETLFS